MSANAIRATAGRPDIEVAFGTVPAGTVGAVRTIASGIVDGREAMVVNAIPFVVDAVPGLLSSLDLPVSVPSRVFE